MNIPSHVVWSKRFKKNEHSRSVTSPVVYRGKVFCFTSDGFLRAIDLSNGTEAWKMQGRFHWASATVAPCALNDKVISFDGGILSATQVDDHKTLWAKPILAGTIYGGSVTTPLVPDGDKIFFSTDAGYLHAVSLRNGEVVWRTRKLNPVCQHE